jgi:hypothetical protein
MRVLAVLLAWTLVGCAWTDSLQSQTTVTIYGRNDGGGDAWFGITPLRDPPEAVGFGSDDGVACLRAAVRSEIVMFDGPPGNGGQPSQDIATVLPEGAPLPNVLWVIVGVDGQLTTGDGVPAWWVGGAQAC